MSATTEYRYLDQYIDQGRIVRDEELWAVNQEQRQCLEPLIQYGERIVIRKVWQVSDFLAGKTTRCLTCQAGSTTDVQTRIADVYKQSGNSRDLNCYGTGFNHGFDPTIYLNHALIEDTDYDLDKDRTGIEEKDQPNMSTGWFPQLQDGDLVIRVKEWENDHTTPKTEFARYVINSAAPVSVRTGDHLGRDQILISSFRSKLFKLPEDHIYQQVPAFIPPPPVVQPILVDIFTDVFLDTFGVPE